MQWLLKLSSEFLRFAIKSDYNRIKDKVEEAAKNNTRPFKSWFSDGSNRVYLQFNKSSNEDINADDLKVIEFLEGLGFVVDYKLGIVIKDRKKIRIGKLLSDLTKKNIETNDIDFFNELKNIYDNSKIRSLSKTKNLLVVISQDPHDIAQMSTGRGWKSCYELDTSGKHDNNSVLCEIESGGLVAYLITNDDKEIKHPIARILIRRFVSEDGKNIAVPEKKIYGTQVDGFLEYVEKWISDRQHIIPDLYQLSGIKHSDTLPKNYFAFDKNISLEKLFQAINLYTGNYYEGKILSDLIYENVNLISDEILSNFIKKMLSYNNFIFLDFNNDRTIEFFIKNDWAINKLLEFAIMYPNRFVEKAKGTKIENILNKRLSEI